MKKIIAHRGLLNGPDKNDENRPEIIENALIQNFDVEIDLWFIDGKWLLGHDNPQYEIQQSFFERDNFWIHCKNFDALNKLNNSNYYFNYFLFLIISKIIIFNSKNFLEEEKLSFENIFYFQPINGVIGGVMI